MKHHYKLHIVALFYIVAAGSAAAETAKEGKYENQGCYIGPHYVISHAKDQMSASYAATGVSIAPQGDPFHDTSGVCYGAWSLINGEFVDSGSCEFLDPSGDKFFGVYSRKNQENGQWRVIGGTGKFSGMMSTGNWIGIVQPPQPTGQLVTCNRQWGTWKLR